MKSQIFLRKNKASKQKVNKLMNVELKNPKIALWAVNLKHYISCFEDWLLEVELEVKKAAKSGADIFILPEYISEIWLHFAPENLKEADELSWQSNYSMAAIEGLKNIAVANNIVILAGTMPVLEDNILANRAYFIMASGEVIHQDKICLTPSERASKTIDLRHGDSLKIFKWRGWNLVILICLDSEVTALAELILKSHQEGHGVDLILCPSMTGSLSGYSRVHACSKARAVELMAAVAVVGCVASKKEEKTHFGGAAVYLPCEAMLGNDGILCKTGAIDEVEGVGEVMISPEIDLRRIRRLRQGYAEVWMGNLPRDLKGETAVLDLSLAIIEKN